MNIYESMNKAFDAEFSKIDAKKQKLTESVEVKEEVEFKPLTIPAAFAKYYRVLQPKEYDTLFGFPYSDMVEEAEACGVDELQYLMAKEEYEEDLAENGLDTLTIYRDGSSVGIGQIVGGRLYPIGLEEITGSITECTKLVKESVKENPLKKLKKSYPELDLDSPQGTDPIKKSDVKSDSPLDKLVKAYPELVIESVREESIEESSVMDKLRKAYPELNDHSNVNESRRCRLNRKKSLVESTDDTDNDLWSKVYGELTMDGKQVPAGKTTKFNIGAGYDYRRIHAGDNGEIRVEANTLEQLRPAADIAIKHKDEGVTYRMRRGSKYDKFRYCIEICIPMEGIAECMNAPKIDECADKPVEEDMGIKNEDLSPIEKLRKAYPELNI